jgi:hypothetical protein
MKKGLKNESPIAFFWASLFLFWSSYLYLLYKEDTVSISIFKIKSLKYKKHSKTLTSLQSGMNLIHTQLYNSSLPAHLKSIILHTGGSASDEIITCKRMRPYSASSYAPVERFSKRVLNNNKVTVHSCLHKFVQNLCELNYSLVCSRSIQWVCEGKQSLPLGSRSGTFNHLWWLKIVKSRYSCKAEVKHFL